MAKGQSPFIKYPNGYIRKISRLEPPKSPVEKSRDFCELAYCAYAKPMAEPERQNELEARYMQIVGTYRDKTLFALIRN